MSETPRGRSEPTWYGGPRPATRGRALGEHAPRRRKCPRGCVGGYLGFQAAKFQTAALIQQVEQQQRRESLYRSFLKVSRGRHRGYLVPRRPSKLWRNARRLTSAAKNSERITTSNEGPRHGAATTRGIRTARADHGHNAARNGGETIHARLRSNPTGRDGAAAREHLDIHQARPVGYRLRQVGTLRSRAWGIR